jgi:hypothetical protein
VTPATKPANVRFYFDADVLGLAKAIGNLRNDLTWPGDDGGVVHKRVRAPCPIRSTGTPDVEWIPVVASHDWLIITRDSRIRDHRAEIKAIRDNAARMIALAGKDARGVWSQLEVFMCQWRAIEATLKEDGPFIYSATRTKLRAVPLD